MIKTPLSTVIGGAFWTPGATIIGSSSKNLTQLIKSIFATGEQGFAYDPNDLTTLYQDANGTIPVTAAGQPVGLMLDKSKGLMLGNEILSGGNFEGGLILTKIDEPSAISTWTLNTNNPISGLQDGLLSVTQAASGRPALYAPSLQSKQGAYEEVSFDYKVISGSANVSGIYTGGGVAVINKALSGTGRFTCRYLRTGIDPGIYIYFGNTLGNVQIDNISVKQILGNHAYQTVSASRPILQQTPILGSELIQDTGFNDAAYWAMNAATINVSGGFANFVSAGTGHNINRPNIITLGKTYQLTFTITSISTGAIRPSISTGTGSLLLGDFNKVGTYTVRGMASGFVPTIQLTAIGTIDATVDNISVKEVTGYHTDQNYLAFDGVDDFLQTNNIDFTATDKVSLFAGVRKLSDVSAGVLCELSTSVANVGSFLIAAPPVSGESTYSTGSNLGVLAVIKTANIYLAPISNVLTTIADGSKPSLRLRVNALTVTDNTQSQGNGKYGNYPFYIGRRGGASLPFSGHLYSLIGIGRLTTDSETITLEKAIAKNTGVTLNV